MALPVLTIVGRPNVGKSTLFNLLTKSRDALVFDRPGVTRDRQYGRMALGSFAAILIDTGGFITSEEELDILMVAQAKQAIEEADALLFLVDAHDGVTTEDENLMQALRQYDKPIYCVMNKIDGVNADIVQTEFYQLGADTIFPISATQNRGLSQLLTELNKLFPSDDDIDDENKGIQLAVIGRPNVGKSTLINKLLGEERVVVCDMPGTTRDTIHIPFSFQGQDFTLVDTAGVRRRSHIQDTLEKFSVIKSLQAIEEANVVIVMLDATEGIVEQDLRLLGYVIEAGKALVVISNKWDIVTEEHRIKADADIERKLRFVSYAKVIRASALKSLSIQGLFKSINKAYESAITQIDTPTVNKLLQKALERHQPPLVRGKRIKLRYAHVGGHNPPIIVVHGTQLKHIPSSYKLFLENFFRKSLKLEGTPIRIEFRQGENPYDKQRK